MGSIKYSHVLFSFVLFLAFGNLYAQGSISPGQLGAEIQELERRLAAGNSPAVRYEAAVRLAHLRQLSGDLAAAAANWLEAAAINPQDNSSLVAGAYCLAAIGEWESASLALRPLLAPGIRGPSMIQARFLDASLRARLYSDVSLLTGLATNPEFAVIRPLIYYTLWRVIAENPGITTAGSADSWRTRLISEFPRSPEARVSASGNFTSPGAGASVSLGSIHNPFWFLFPGVGTSNYTIPSRPIAPPVAAAPPTAPIAPAAPPTMPTAQPGTGGPALQTGVFSREANAQSQAEALRRAGFTATITRRLVNGAEHWAVTVPAGADSNRTIQELRRAGFDSFLIRN